MMSSILFTKARFAFLSEWFDELQYKAVAVTIPSIAPIISECFIFVLLILLCDERENRCMGNIVCVDYGRILYKITY